MDIIGHRNVFYAISALAFAGSVAALALWGLRLGIDFTGGALLEVEFASARPGVGEVGRRLDPLALGDVRVQPSGERGVILRFRHVSEDTHQAILEALGDGTLEKRFDAIGPTIGRELWRKSEIAVALVILLIVAYIAWAFRKVSRPMASWKYGVTTVVALLHDIVIPAGLFAVAGRLWGIEADTLFVTAILTILGFSVHDTIVVFDRIRENIKKAEGTGDFSALVNRSVNETFVRSVTTSLTVALAMTSVWFFGGPTTSAFSATLLLGVVVGTYSSMFIASPLLVTWQQFQAKVTR